MSKPLVSIVIPVYNYGNVVAEAIQSCLQQTCDLHEIVVINDGSNDNTDEVATRFGDKVTYISQTNQGVAKTRNTGAARSKGEWLLFLDADDQLYPDAVSSLISCVENDDAGIVFGRVRQQKKGKWMTRFNPRLAGNPPLPASINFYNTAIPTPGAAIVRRSVFDRAGGFETNLHPVEDRHFWLKCGVLTPFKACDQDVLEKRIHEGCASWNVNRMVYKRFIVQLDFLSWCYRHGIDHSFIEQDQVEIAERNVKEAIWYKAWEGILAIILHAKFCNITSPVLEKCLKIVRFSDLAPSSVTARLLTRALS